MKYQLRIVHNDEIVDTQDCEATTPKEASKAAKELQQQRRKQGLDGIVVPFLS